MIIRRAKEEARIKRERERERERERDPLSVIYFYRRLVVSSAGSIADFQADRQYAASPIEGSSPFLSRRHGPSLSLIIISFRAIVTCAVAVCH